MNNSHKTTKIIFISRKKNFLKGHNYIDETDLKKSEFPKFINHHSNKEKENVAFFSP